MPISNSSQGNLIYQGIEPNDPEAKNLKLTAWALEDLEVDGMRGKFQGPRKRETNYHEHQRAQGDEGSKSGS